MSAGEASPEQAPGAGPRWVRRLAVAAGVCAVCLVATAGGLALAIEEQPLDPAYAGPRPRPPQLLARFAYPEQGSAPELSAEFRHAEHPAYQQRWVQFPVSLPEDPRPHLVQVIHYRSKAAGRRPAVVVTPIMGGDNEIAMMMARNLAERGIHAGVVLRAESYFVGEAPAERLVRVLRTAIVDRRRAIDWFQSLDEVDPARIGAFGVSMGGIVTTLLAAVEPRVSAAVVMLAGGDVPELVATSAEPRIQRYRRERAAAGVSADALRARLRAAVGELDPLTLAPYVDARRLLFVSARRDHSVPSPQQERLHRALGGPARIDLPTGHYASALYLPYLLQRALEFLAAQLGE